MNSPDDLTITVSLASPELRSVAIAVLDALSDLEAAVMPPLVSGGGARAGKPESKAPAGSAKAIHLAADMVRDADGWCARVAKHYREMDPAELTRSKEWRANVRRMKAEAREAVLVTVQGGKLVAKMPAPGRSDSIPSKTREQAIALCTKGLSQRAVAERLGIGHTTVYRLMKERLDQ